MHQPSIAFIDVAGIPYDGTTLSKRGLGGSETAVMQMAKELGKIGFDVTVYNNPLGDDTSPGIYDNVVYKSVWEREEVEQDYDIVVSSRTVYPFLRPGQQVEEQKSTDPWFFSDYYTNITKNAKWKAIWWHDTFSHGEVEIEDLLVSGQIDEMFVLSDWHMTYVLNCEHRGFKRNYEVLKRKTFITRNGMVPQPVEVDIAKKDRNLFVYNASVSKGMDSLLLDCWPRIKQQIHDARLVIIGGYYTMGENRELDAQQLRWHELYNTFNGKNGITFTGIITLKEIADILSKASFFLYPAIYPETFGISTLEAHYYNCVPITCRFGALEETAIDLASYKIDYSIRANGLFPHIDNAAQINKFVDAAVEAYNNTYLTQQKAYYGNIVKEVAGWDTVAMEWKQHLFHKLGLYMSAEENRKANYTLNRVKKIFNRRTSNLEQSTPTPLPEKPIYVISPFYNGSAYIGNCIKSVAAQNYENYRHLIIDDASKDAAEDEVVEAINEIGSHRGDKITWYTNEVNQGAVYNQINTARARVPEDDAIVILLDGDDWLVNDPEIFNYINELYHRGAEFTYGSCWSLADNIPLIAQPYPTNIREAKAYREHKFNWGIPYTHLRTFKRSLLTAVPDTAFQDQNGEWFRAGGDVAVFYNLIEKAAPDSVIAVSDILVNYNDLNPLNDYKVNSTEQTITANKATGNSRMKKILIAVPTAKNIEADTFKSIYDLEVPAGYDVDFQYFYGYNVEQVRNLIAHYTIQNGYDYLFGVDSDIILPKDCLSKMIVHDKDIVTGVYIQRIPGTHTIEVYGVPPQGGMVHIPYDDLKRHHGLVEVAGCGFGCVLVKRHVLEGIEYPHFQYKSAIHHKDTVSEDVYFCMKARDNGFRVWCDTTILCDHIGSTVFKV